MTYTELRKLEISVIRILSLIRRFCGNENISKAIDYAERAIMTIRQLQMAMRALEMASGPIGWLYALVSVAGVGASVAVDMYDVTRSNQ